MLSFPYSIVTRAGQGGFYQDISYGKTFATKPKIAVTLPNDDAVCLFVQDAEITTSSVRIRARNYYSANRTVSGTVYVIPQ